MRPTLQQIARRIVEQEREEALLTHGVNMGDIFAHRDLKQRLARLRHAGKIPPGLREQDLMALLQRELGVTDTRVANPRVYHTDTAVSGTYQGRRWVFGADRRGAIDVFHPMIASDL